jgi:hypothetical protein
VLRAEDACNQLFKIRSRDASDPQNRFVDVFKMVPKLWREYGTLDEIEHRRRGDCFLLYLLEGLSLQISSADMLDIPLFPRGQLLGKCQQLILGDIDILNEDSSVCRLARMGQDSPHGFSCCGQAASADELIATIVYLGLSLLEVDEHPTSQTPVEKWSIKDQCVASQTLSGELVQMVFDLDFVGVDGQGFCQWVVKIATKPIESVSFFV